MRIFKALSNIIIMDKLIILKDNLVKFENEDGVRMESVDKLLSFVYNLSDIEKDEKFVEIFDYNIDVIELPEDEDDIIKNYRLQLDIKTSKKKLIEIEILIRNLLNENGF